MSFYAIVRVVDLTQNIVENLLSPNAYNLRISHPDEDGFKHAVLEFDNLPFELLIAETPVLAASEIADELDADPIWGELPPFAAPIPLAPAITNLSLPTPDTEVSHTLQEGIKSLILRNRTRGDTKIAFISGDSGVKYIELKAGAVLSLPSLDFTFRIDSFDTIYLQSDIVSTIEILELYT